MAIDKNLAEPPTELRSCARCGKSGAHAKLAGTLIHWPSEGYDKPMACLWGTQGEIEPFSLWSYTCRWCRAAETRRSRNQKGT